SNGGKDWHFQLEYYYRESPARFGPVAAANPAPPAPRQKEAKGSGRVQQQVLGPVEGKRELRMVGEAYVGGGGMAARVASWSFEPDGPAGDGPTRELAIRAEGQRITVRWPGADDYTVDKMPSKDLDRVRKLLVQQPEPPLEFSARGGLGVSVHGGSV